MKNRNKRAVRSLAASLAVALLAAQAQLPVLGAEEQQETIRIRNEEEFLLLADQCRTEGFSAGKYISLEADLELGDYENICVPVMNGFFEGNGHEIRGLVWTEEMSDYGLFRYVGEDGAVQNLTVEARILGSEEQEYGGIIAGSNAGEIAGCVSRGSISGQNGVGGIAGINEESGEILHSRNEAQVNGRNRTGGIAGENAGRIAGCTNQGGVNTEQKVKKAVDGDGSAAISIPNAVSGLAKDERANQTGGIAGLSTGEIEDCTNQGTIGYEHLGYETGGVAGRQSGSVSRCVNEGVIRGRKDVGGIAGYLEPFEALSYDRDYRQELEEELDTLADLGDDLGDAANQLGDHFSGELDRLTEQLKQLRSSIRGYLDSYGNLADDGRDDIEEQVDQIRETLNGMDYDFGMKKIHEHAQKISQDMARMKEILEILKAWKDASGGEAAEQVRQIVEQYEQELGRLQGELDALQGALTESGGQEEPEEENPEPEIPESETPEKEEAPEKEELPETEGPESGESQKPEAGNTPGTEAPEAEEPPKPEEPEAGKTPGTEAPETEESPKPEEPESGKTPGAEEPETEEPPKPEEPEAENIPEQESQGQAEPADGAGQPEGTMTLMAFTSAGTEKKLPDQAELEQLQEYLRELAALSEDIRLQLKGIVESLQGSSGQAGSLYEDLKKLGGGLGGLEKEIGDVIDDFGDEMDVMKEDLRNQGNGISDQFDHTADTLDADWDSMSDILDRMQDQFGVIRGTIFDGFDELMNRIEDRTVYVDVSELLEDGPGSGVLFACENSGEIYADSQGGGIAGSITKGSGGDAVDWFQELTEGKGGGEDQEEEPDSLTRHVQAAVTGCVNKSDVSVTNDYAGGVVGRASYGVIRGSQNYGDVQAEEGSYAGGIAGKSENGIYGCYALCGVAGKSYVGGAAGSAEDLSGSYICSYLDLEEDYVKYSGALAGKAEGTVENNYFVDQGVGAVDGVTRSREAQGLDYEGLMSLPDQEMPEDFRKFKVKFVDQGEVVWEKDVSYGESIFPEEYPELSAPEDGYAYWEEKDLSRIVRNVTVHAVYRGYIPSLASESGTGKSEILLGGNFYPDSVFAAVKSEDTKAAEESLKNAKLLLKYRLKRVYHYSLTQKEELQNPVHVRILAEDRGDTLAVLNSDMELLKLQKAETRGSYLEAEFPLEPEGYLVVLDKRGW